MAKTAQLQIRVSAHEKEAIQLAARRAGVDMSSWVLERALPSAHREFQDVLRRLKDSARPSYVIAELSDLLTRWSPTELNQAVQDPPATELDTYWVNYVAAMVETTMQRRGQPIPAWTRDIVPLRSPAWGTELQSLRLHLLTASPPAFRRRNIFIDATVGDRV